MLFIILGIVAAVLVLLGIIGYLKAPPDTAYIIAGLGR